MAPRQPKGMDTTNKRVATSCQRQQCDLMGAGNRGDRFVFDLFKNRISQLKKVILEKDKIISFLTEQLSVKNAFTILSMTVLNLKYLGRKRIQLN